MCENVQVSFPSLDKICATLFAVLLRKLLLLHFCLFVAIFQFKAHYETFFGLFLFQLWLVYLAFYSAMLTIICCCNLRTFLGKMIMAEALYMQFCCLFPFLIFTKDDRLTD